ncbi:MAG: nucleotidyltransferase domain-containing protein [Oscillospiraceae bacterium]|nr:nucleotidyltransferase domain-containing protein [Oscillospiraceae bacterium]
MDIDSKTELDRYISYISDIEGVSRVYLFGSHAYGVPDDGSDIDLLVIIDDSLDAFKTAYTIQKGLADRNVSLDVLVNRVFDFNNASEGTTFQSHIRKEGVLLYERQ